MDDLINRQAAIDAISLFFDKAYIEDADVHKNDMLYELILVPSTQSEIIRCKDCKHKPHTSDKYDYDNGDCGFEIIFPDYRCPCRCEDEYYNHMPDDDWYCGNAERKEDERFDQ